MNALSDFVTKVAKPTKPEKAAAPPNQRTAADLQTALFAAQATLPDLEAAEALHALDVADGVEGSDNALQAAKAALSAAKERIHTIEAAIKGATAREQAASSKARAEIRAAQVANVQRLLERREREADALMESLAETVKRFRALIDLSDRARIAWPGGNAPAGTALTAKEIIALVEAEIFRVGGSVFLGGGQSAAAPSFPGGRQSDFRVPAERMKSLTQSLAEADDFGVNSMNGGTP